MYLFAVQKKRPIMSTHGASQSPEPGTASISNGSGWKSLTQSSQSSASRRKSFRENPILHSVSNSPRTDCGSERVFARAGDLITKKRNRLAPESADSIMCLRYWLGLPEVTEDEIKRFEGAQEEGQEHEFLVDHYLPEVTMAPGRETTVRMGASWMMRAPWRMCASWRMRAFRRTSTRIWAPWWTNLKRLLVVMRGLRLGASSDGCRWKIVDRTL
jgi:hypothetical protein